MLKYKNKIRVIEHDVEEESIYQAHPLETEKRSKKQPS